MFFLRSILIILVGLFVSLNVLAQETTTTVVEKKIITPAPKPTCTTVAAHWEGTTWVYDHTVCKYENRSEGAAWVSEYWSCTQASDDGSCMSWSLIPGHWVKTLE